MLSRPVRVVVLALSVLLAGVSAPAFDELPQAARELMAEPRFKHAHWGLLVTDLKTGAVLYEVNPDRLFVPASTTKCFSVACALDELGADYRFETPVFLRGTLKEDGELQGDLILRASGDLTMGGRTLPDGRIDFRDSDHTYASGGTDTQLTVPDPLAGLHELAKQIAAAGIKRVHGEVLVDDRLFDRAESSGSGPDQVAPILINDNVIDITIAPGEAGQPGRVTWRPQTTALVVDVRVETVATDGSATTSVRSLGPGRILVSGTIPAGHKPVIHIQEVADPASFARSLFIEALEKSGVRVDASALADHPRTGLPVATDYSGLKQVACLKSPPFSENAKLILKVSHNLHASTLPLLVAAKYGERTLAQGLHRQAAFLKRAGVEAETISFAGAAGGTRADYVTPRAATALLRYMATRPDFECYFNAMPRLGVDGTLASVVDDKSPARDKVQAKTGTLYWTNTLNDSSLLTSKALAGYMTTADDRRLAFALFVNMVHLRDGVTTRSIGKDLGRLAEILQQTKAAH